jgi:dTDP-4-dehydrorhamnose 3,5-epimerase
MKHYKHSIFNDVIIFTPNVYTDERGYFLESYNNYINDILGISFLQDNHSKSNKYVFRGFHFQWDKPMSKLFRVITGSGIGVILDIRKSSLTYKQHVLIDLNDKNNNILFVPSGFAIGFLSLENNTHLCYKCSAIREADNEGTIYLFDPELKVNLGIDKNNIILSDKDKNANLFKIYNNNPKFI